jgi:arylsulfatase A-like enzyme
MAWAPAGALGGTVAGLMDGALAVGLSREGGLDAAAVMLVILSAGLLGLAGALAGAVVGVLTGLVPQHRVRTAAMVVTGLAAPLIVYDALALFGGARARLIPARNAISTGLVIAGLAAIYGAFFVVRGWLARGDRAGGRAAGVTLAALGLVVGLAASAANHRVLPRLYSWFHLTLGILAVVACAIAVRALLGRGGRPRVALLAVVVPVVFTATTFFMLGRNARLRFMLLEKTVVAAELARVLPLPRPGRRRVVPAGTAGTQGPLPEGPKRPEADVVLVTIDALRHDHVGAYGYPRPTTPNLDALAARGVRFARAYAQAPHTSFSVASLLTGKYYPTLLRLGGGEADEPVTSVLKRYGWRTAVFYPPAVFYVDGDKLAAFRDGHFGFEYVKVEFLDAFARIEQIKAYFAEVKPQRAFVWVHFFEPHEPYDARQGHDFGDGDVDRYDSEIAYTDAALGALVAYLQEERPGAIVIVAADHGEEFDDHGGRYHGSSLFDEQVRVPFVVAVPGAGAHVVDGGAVGLVDVAPTILRLLDIPVPARMRGTDLGPWLASPPAPGSRLPPEFAELEHKRMIASGTDKLICHMEIGHCSLFDLTADPGERRNLVDAQPDKVGRLRAEMDLWLAEQGKLEAKRQGRRDADELPRAIERGRLGDTAVADELVALATSASADSAVRVEAARLLATLAWPAATRTRLRSVLPGAFAREEEEEAARQGGPLVAWLAIAAVAAGTPEGKAAQDQARDQAGQPGAVASPVSDALNPLDASDAVVALDAPEAHARARLVSLAAGPAAASTEQGTEQGPDDPRLWAALVLGRRGEKVGVPALAAGLDTCGDPVFCREIILALGNLGDPRAVPSLIAHLPDVLTRRELVVALGQIADPRAARPVAERLVDDEYVPVRAAAAEALARISGARARATLARARRQEKEAPVRAAIDEALARVRARKPRGG